jgi:ABC-type antimicrobial peptide transport system permease subunit
MLKHNLLIIFRNFKRNKSSFFINLIGLSTGLACALLIYLWVNDEMNFDRFHEKNSQLFQVIQQFQHGETLEPTPGPLADAIIAEIPEVEYAVPVTPDFLGKPTLSNDDKNTKAGFVYAGKDFFRMFSFQLIDGNVNQVLSDKNSIVLSEELAMKLFNTTSNIIGRTLKMKHQFFPGAFQVSGIFKRVPLNSSLQFDFVLPFNSIYDQIPSWADWRNNNPNTYVLLKQEANVGQFNDKIANLIERKCGDSSRTLFLRPYADKYLYGAGAISISNENGQQAGNRIEYVKLFSLIAIFILIIACINFMNLSTAKASGRMKEIGMKKAVGADRKSLIIQHLSESILMAILSLAVAILIVELLLPQFNEITGKHIALTMNANIILSALGISLFTGFIAGSYPALYLSGFNPVHILKGRFHSSSAELWTRKGLVIFQFVISGILIVSVLVIYKQIEFIQTKKLGYNKDNIIYFDKEGSVTENLDAFLAELKNIPGVVNASSSAFPIIDTKSSTEDIRWEGKALDMISRFNVQFINYDFIDMHGIEMKGGRTFSRDFGSDNSKIIFNEAAIKMMGLKDPVGKSVNMWGIDRQIIGVTKDFHFESLHELVKPMLFILAPAKQNMRIMVKIKADNEKKTINRLGEFYKKYNPSYVFEYKFLDEDYQAQYVSETRVAVLSRYFAGIAIIISCLGLFGLAAFSAERRQKEIGIRKVLGSSELGIIALLTNDFTKIVLVSILISIPVSYFITKNWLDSFAYRIDLSPWYFVGAGVTTLVIALATVSFQAIKAATANPVEALRYE